MNTTKCDQCSATPGTNFSLRFCCGTITRPGNFEPEPCAKLLCFDCIRMYDLLKTESQPTDAPLCNVCTVATDTEESGPLFNLLKQYRESQKKLISYKPFVKRRVGYQLPSPVQKRRRSIKGVKDLTSLALKQ